MMRTALITAGAALAVLVLVLLATIIITRSMVRRCWCSGKRCGRPVKKPGGGAASAPSPTVFSGAATPAERLLRLIDILERSEDDPGRLASLFQIDHLVTRMRRNSDSALVLAGHEIT